MTLPTPGEGFTEPVPEEPHRSKLAEVFTEELDDVLADLHGHGILVARVIADEVVEKTFEEAEAALEVARAEQDKIEQDTRSSMFKQIGALLGSRVARMQAQETDRQRADAEAATAHAKAEYDDIAATTRNLLNRQVVAGVHLLIMQRHLSQAEAEVATFREALYGKHYLLGRADAGLYARELQAAALDDKITRRKAELEGVDARLQEVRMRASIHQPELEADGYRWPNSDEDQGTGIIADEEPHPDDSLDALPNGRIVTSDGAFDPGYVGPSDNVPTRVFPAVRPPEPRV